MANPPAAPSDDVLRTQHYLAEVIDECVFVERQRELTERRLSSQLQAHKNLIAELFSALRDVCRYTAIVEDAVLPALLESLRGSSAARLQLLESRSGIHEKLMRLRGGGGGDQGINVLLPPAPRMCSDARSANVSVVLLDNAAEVGREMLQRLVAREADLVDALGKATTRLNTASIISTTENCEFEVLRRRVDQLSQHVDSSESRPLKTASVFPAPPGPISAAQAPEIALTASAEFNKARTMAYEKTIQALNTELALLHENYAALSRANTREVDALKQRMIDAERKHKNHIAECDAVLGRISLELEQLIHENAQLKHTLRAATGVD
ncbi:hypothetical protein JKF63_01518 [Porcisia hertigi]|uniref:Uncharacterized protein n=1 Tax=Porcisia hertigi TaxID=2761500 RepID=A0A836LA29_9TRYP|nr:hypothetical protein JKF63_01518 [Porcisia hertigi]